MSVVNQSPQAVVSESNKQAFSPPPLYAIVNVESLRDPLAYIKALSSSGVELLQLRAKTCPRNELFTLYQNCLIYRDTVRGKGGKLQIIINDDTELAAELGADGVHLGQEDQPVRDARRILGPEAIIGLSTHSTEQLQAAPSDLLDYLALGPIFLSPTKQGHAEIVGIERLKEAAQISKLPIVAIGGINLENAKEIYRAGAESLAVISDLERSPDLGKSVAEYNRLFSEAHRGSTQAGVV